MDLRGHKAENVAVDIRDSIGVEAIGLKLMHQTRTLLKMVWIRHSLHLAEPDILINGAGINAATPFLDIKIDEFNDVIKSQINSTLFGCQVFGEYMLDRAKGQLSIFPLRLQGPPLSKAFAYSIAKAGILNLTQNLAREWGTRVSGSTPYGLDFFRLSGTAKILLLKIEKQLSSDTHQWRDMVRLMNLLAG